MSASGEASLAKEGVAVASRASPADGRVRDCLVIVLCGALLGALLFPFQDTPFVDDWVYAWSVQRLLDGDGLLLLDWSSHPNFAHVLWGALFCLPAGFSFVAVRLSTWIAALIGLCALYLLLRELRVARRESLLGAAALGTNPVFLMLAATFMTDVPFVAATLCASFALVAALERRSGGWLVVAAGFAGIATAVRVVGAATPVAMMLALLVHGGAWGRRPARLVVAGAPLAFFAVLLLWGEARTVHVTDLSGIVGSPDFRRAYFLSALSGLPGLVLRAILCIAGSLGLALLPVTLPATTPRAARRALGFLVALLLLAGVAWAAGVAWPPALEPGFTWTWGELGATEALVEARQAIAVGPAATALATGAGFLSFAVACALAARRLAPGEAFLAWSFAGQAGLVAILWLFYDRYLIALLPFAIALVLTGRPPLRRGVAVALVALFGIVGAVGVRDHLSYNAALWEAVARLQARGVPDEQIDAGYVVNGWLHFAHPENAPRTPRGERYFPWVTDPGGSLPFQIANQPLPGWKVIDRVRFRRWLGRSGELFVLARPQPSTPP